jgi:hypothetical protein
MKCGLVNAMQHIHSSFQSACELLQFQHFANGKYQAYAKGDERERDKVPETINK